LKITADWIPCDEIGNVFDKFYRLKNTKRVEQGLGLSIAKGFTEVMKGNISLQNVPTGGARFTIEIPVKCRIKKYNNEQAGNINH
jgi:two-component system sensor histidine kinase KdpD